MSELSLRRLLVKNTGAQMASQGVSLLVAFVTSFTLSRYLGVDGFGQFNYVFAFFYFAFTINDFGVNTIVVREIARDTTRASEIIGGMISFKLLLSVVSMALAWSAIWLMRFPSNVATALYTFSLILPIMALQFPSVIFQVLLKAEISAAIGIFNRCTGFLLMMLMVYLGRGLTSIVAALVVGELASLFLLLKLSRRLVRPRFHVDFGLWLRILKSSIPLGGAGVFVALINRVDFLMLERMTDTHQLGLYSAAYKVTNVLESVPLMVMGTLYPLMSRYAVENVPRLRELYRKSVVYLGTLGISIAIGVTLFAPQIVRGLFGQKFVGADRGLATLVWATAFLYISISAGNLLISAGLERISFLVLLVASSLNIGLNIVLIPDKGFVGAALATAATFCFMLIANAVAVEIYFARRASSQLEALRASGEAS
jgi:O-antigen/teichoic acid export membrane protein